MCVTTQNNPAKTGEKGWFNIQNAAGMIFKVPEGSEDAAKDEAGAMPKPGKKALPIRGTNSAFCSLVPVSPSIRSSRLR